jgi:hypothetical protein
VKSTPVVAPALPMLLPTMPAARCSTPTPSCGVQVDPKTSEPSRHSTTMLADAPRIPPVRLIPVPASIEWSALTCTSKPLSGSEFWMRTLTVRIDPTAEVAPKVLWQVEVFVLRQTVPVAGAACADGSSATLTIGIRRMNGIINSVLDFFKLLAPVFPKWVFQTSEYKSFRRSEPSL